MKMVIKLPPKESRFLKIKEGFVWNGSRFQVDSESQRLIASKALSVIKAQLSETVYGTIKWRTFDNLFHEFSPEEFLLFATAVEQHIENILYTSWNAIDNGE